MCVIQLKKACEREHLNIDTRKYLPTKTGENCLNRKNYIPTHKLHYVTIGCWMQVEIPASILKTEYKQNENNYEKYNLHVSKQ